jgi:hypothetical protein
MVHSKTMANSPIKMENPLKSIGIFKKSGDICKLKRLTTGVNVWLYIF